MENKIQELTDKIYKEGVLKGNEEAQKIVTEAEKKAADIVAKAQKEAEEAKKNAEREAQNLKEKTASEISLYARQAIASLQSEIADMISDKVAKKAAEKVVNEKEILNNFMLQLARCWDGNQEMLITTPEAEELKKLFMAQAKEQLDKGLSIEQVDGRKGSFTVMPKDGSYKVNLNQEVFEDYFKSFLRPQLVQTLFGKETE